MKRSCVGDAGVIKAQTSLILTSHTGVDGAMVARKHQ